MEGLKSMRSALVYTCRIRHLLPLVRASKLIHVKALYRNRASKLSHSDNTLPSKGYIQQMALFTEKFDLWRNADAVCFDVDSTVAMGGSVPLEEALAARLSLFNPSLSQVQDFLNKRPLRYAKKMDVYLISGGFRQMINPVASILGIPSENIFANQLLFGSSGEFLGFDTNEPTSRSSGKATAVQQIRKAHGYKALVMIGDGATDLEVRKPGGADLFICYVGVQLREAVAAKADWLVFNFKDLINSLD
ncbi:hypothetical protein ACJRO7_008209 [Eucalyptus globulus]|uniref:phosphoserine phosphatase n=1 Tax=Eucalyptus globulus TaxID=34317 RepID=A0ABD3IR83_EUCGL